MSISAKIGERHFTTVYPADLIYQTAELDNLWMGEEDEGIRLFYGEVVGNDGPGAGRSDEEGIEPFVAVEGLRVLRKLLTLEEPATEKVMLAFIARECEDNQATLCFTVNGHAVSRPPSRIATPDARQYWKLTVRGRSWSRWYYVEVSPEVLWEGENEITVEAVDGQSGWELMVADYRDFHKGMEDPVVLPETSQVSEDGGKTWSAERGEYVLRLALQRFRRKGELVSSILDAAGEEDIKRRLKVRQLRLDWEVECPPDSTVEFQVRTGAHPVKMDGWSDWQPCASGSSLESVRGRYLQWKAELTSAAPEATPLLGQMQVDAVAQMQRVESEVRVLRADNARVLHSASKGAIDDWDCRSLKELRERFELDAVVAGARTEFEKIERLLEWAYFVPLGDCLHFPWNVLDWLILERDEAGGIRMNQYEQRRRDKMCLYPNVVLVAACLSMGIPARHVNFHSEGMTGHEIAEVWSNDYGKWVHMDATRDYYWYDPKTRVPLDTLEIHQALTERLEGAERWDRPYLFHQDLEELVRDLPIAFREGKHPFSVEEGALFLFRSFCHFRIVPRYDLFSRERPLPVSQGTEVWAWDGYLNWADDKVPPLLHFSHHTNRREDFYPSLNQTRYAIEVGENPGELQVFLDTNMSRFSHFLVKLDGGNWREGPDEFTWALHPGLNNLHVRAHSKSGADGGISFLSVVAGGEEKPGYFGG
ncbi:MAG: transglutaminase domain-containing protein [Gemmatimonadetes bacterium]|jgi:hypothetical protein|nr:transglutaminase domain-containing protein [Gemmatimonadota bacterium]